MSAASLQVLDEAFEHAEQLRASWQLDAAEDAYRALPQDERLRPRVLTEIAITLAHQGRGAEALAAIAEAEMLAPQDATIAQNRLILEKLREPEDPDLFLTLHRRYGERFVPTRAELFKQQRQRGDGPLRIAYLGVDAHTALARFVPMLATHHDRSRCHAAFFYGASDEARINDARRRFPQVAHVSIKDIAPRDLAIALCPCERCLPVGHRSFYRVLKDLCHPVFAPIAPTDNAWRSPSPSYNWTSPPTLR